MTDSSEAALRAEIARLTGAINQRKNENQVSRPNSSSFRFNGNNKYVNPNYKPTPNPQHLPTVINTKAIVSNPPSTNALRPHEVVIDGVAFQSSRRSLVRKDLPQATLTAKISNSARTKPEFNKPSPRSTHRPYKARTSRRKPINRNMSLANGRAPQQDSRKFPKTLKYSNKQCSKFSTTGICQRGRTCPYQHDPAKVAICWPFLQGSCPNTANACLLSHDSTPERTPLCVHFANNGRCKQGDACLFPHVRVGQRIGVCRDFAVLGFCEKGLDCDKQHVRECPDFADNGNCPNPKCRLPHVIRANRNSQTKAKEPLSANVVVATTEVSTKDSKPINLESSTKSSSADDANLGDEYISFTFHESDLSDDDDENESDDDEAEDDDTEDDDVSDNADINEQ